MWATIILPLLRKYWLKLLAGLALIGAGIYGGARITGALNRKKIEKAERKAEEAIAVAEKANQVARSEVAKTEQIETIHAIKEKEEADEEAIQDTPDDKLLDGLNDMFNGPKTD